MKPYQYQLIQYTHDQFTGEFVNMGLIVYAPENGYLECKINTRYKRLKDFFPTANGKFAKTVLQHIDKMVASTAASLSQLFKPSDNLATITKNILPPDNSAIRLSEVKTAVDVDFKTVLDFLYFELVEKNTEEGVEKYSLTDEEVWKDKYKHYFDKYNLSKSLKSHTVATPNDTFTFDIAWKNERWHCYEPVSFYLLNKESVKDKVYKWAGRVKGLQDADEKLHLTLLTSINPDFPELKGFMDRLIEVHDNNNVAVDIVFEDEAEEVAKSIRKQMDEHDSSSSN